MIRFSLCGDAARIDRVVSQMPDCRKAVRCDVYGTALIVPNAQKVRAFAERTIGHQHAARLINDILSAYQDEIDSRNFLRSGR